MASSAGVPPRATMPVSVSTFCTSAIVLEKLQTVEAKNLELSGTVNAKAHGDGTLDNPNVTASVELPSLQLQQTSITGIKAQLNVAAHRLENLIHDRRALLAEKPVATRVA